MAVEETDEQRSKVSSSPIQLIERRANHLTAQQGSFEQMVLDSTLEVSILTTIRSAHLQTLADLHSLNNKISTAKQAQIFEQCHNKNTVKVIPDELRYLTIPTNQKSIL